MVFNNFIELFTEEAETDEENPYYAYNLIMYFKYTFFFLYKRIKNRNCANNFEKGYVFRNDKCIVRLRR